MKFRVNEHVRIKRYPKGDINEFGRVNSTRGDKYWVTNLNMPYVGTVSEFFDEDELEKKDA